MLVPNAKPNWSLGFFTLAIFLTQVALGLYVYKIKYDVQLDYLKEIRKDVWKEEIREILSDPEFHQLIRGKGFDHPITRSKRETVAKLKDLKEEDLGNIRDYCIEVQKCDSADALTSAPIAIRISDLPAAKTEVLGPRGNSESCVKGEPGPSGPPGAPGLPGLRGDVGLHGFPGPVGLKGSKGDRGLPGLSGVPGLKGDSGRLGFPGVSGLDGPPGMPGSPGAPGKQGPKGDTGSSGPSRLNLIPVLFGPPKMKGDQGKPGYNGLNGLPGPSGTKGDRGFVGFRGLPGSPGIPGVKGEPGRHGLPGIMGANGARGLPGLKGLPGPMGPQGPSGKCQSCSGGVYLNNPSELLITSTNYGDNDKYLDFSLSPTSKGCDLVAIQEPAAIKIQTYNDEPYGAWMVDSAPLTKGDAKKIWVTTTDNYTLFEHNDASTQPTSTYKLLVPFNGNKHVVYNGAFFYEEAHKNPRIIKYNLNDESIKGLHIPGLTSENSKQIYRDNENYLDFSVDENGLWVIFAVPDTNNTGVVKINANSMTIEKIWNITLNHRSYDEMFIASAVLYPISGTAQGEHRVDLAFNLFEEKLFTPDLHIIGQCARTPVTYDHKNKQILTWNNGNLMAYPVEYRKVVDNSNIVAE